MNAKSFRHAYIHTFLLPPSIVIFLVSSLSSPLTHKQGHTHTQEKQKEKDREREREEATLRHGQEENREGQLLCCPSSAFFFIRVVLSFRRREGL